MVIGIETKRFPYTLKHIGPNSWLCFIGNMQFSILLDTDMRMKVYFSKEPTACVYSCEWESIPVKEIVSVIIDKYQDYITYEDLPIPMPFELVEEDEPLEEIERDYLQQVLDGPTINDDKWEHYATIRNLNKLQQETFRRDDKDI